MQVGAEKLSRNVAVAILTAVAHGLITDAIADQLDIGPGCVKAHLRTAIGATRDAASATASVVEFVATSVPSPVFRTRL